MGYLLLLLLIFYFISNNQTLKMAATTEIKAEKAKALSKPSKHLFMILLPLPFLVGIGIVGNQQGWIGGPKQ